MLSLDGREFDELQVPERAVQRRIGANDNRLLSGIQIRLA